MILKKLHLPYRRMWQKKWDSLDQKFKVSAHIFATASPHSLGSRAGGRGGNGERQGSTMSFWRLEKPEESPSLFVHETNLNPNREEDSSWPLRGRQNDIGSHLFSRLSAIMYNFMLFTIKPFLEIEHFLLQLEVFFYAGWADDGSSKKRLALHSPDMESGSKLIGRTIPLTRVLYLNLIYISRSKLETMLANHQVTI